MLKLDPKPTFWSKQRVRVPGGEVCDFEVEFVHMTRDGIRAFLESAGSRDELAVIAEIVVGWRGLDADFSAENLKRLLSNYPGLSALLLTEYAGEMMRAREGN